MSTATPRLETSIRQHFQPLLKADGFAGSGRTFRKVSADLIQVVNVQGSQSGGQFAINLGLHPVAIPDVSGQIPDPKKITEMLCEFSRRLSESGADQWWKHDGTQESMDAAVLAAADVHERVGKPLFAVFGSADSPLHSITADEMPRLSDLFRGFETGNFRTALVLARLRKSQGRSVEARGFAVYALEHLGAAKGFRAELDALCRLES